MRHFLGPLAVLFLLHGFLSLIYGEVSETVDSEKRQLTSPVLSAALPALHKLLNDTHLDQIPLEGTELTLHFHTTHCWLYGRKRLLDFPTITNTCIATVTEEQTMTNESCTDCRQDRALKCALDKEIKRLIDLARTAPGQAVAPLVRRQPIRGLLSAALPVLGNLLNGTNVDKLIESLDLVKDYFSHFIDHSGEIPLKGTEYTLHYHVTHCWRSFKKRLLDVPTITNTCMATVTEAKTKTTESCTDRHQVQALGCAVTKEIQRMIYLANAP